MRPSHNLITTGRLRWCVVLLCLGSVSAYATLTARFTPNAPKIDGILDEKAWQEVRASSEFVGPLQSDGLAQPAEAATRVRVLWDAHSIYIGFDCDGAPETTSLLEHDAELHYEELVEVFLDLVGLGTDYAELQLSPTGVRADIRHHWSQRPTYAATHIDEEQRRSMSSDHSWNLLEWRTAVAPRREDGEIKGWTAEMAVPISAFGVESLHDGFVFKANFAHYRYKTDVDGKRRLLPATWQAVQYGRPHVSPMAMGTVRCIVTMPPTSAFDAWTAASRLLVTDAHQQFREDSSQSRETLFGEAVTLLNIQPRTEANILKAADIFIQLSSAVEPDEYALASRYFLGRIEQVHRFNADPAKAKLQYEQLMRDAPESLYAQLAGVKLCLLTLYASEREPVQRLAAAEKLEPFFQQSEARRDYHLAMADAYVRLERNDKRLLYHLLAAEEGELGRTVRGDLYARIVDVAIRLGHRRLAIDYCHKFLGLRLRASRVSVIEHRLKELEATQ